MNYEGKKPAFCNRVVGLCLLVLSCLFAPSRAYAVYNVVWQDDFGVVEDSVVRGFANPNMSMPGYILAINNYWFLDKNHYGIMNSTKWSFIRKGFKTEEQHFYAGRDHTGNPNGAMLVVNGSDEKSVVYEYNIESKLCEKRKYRFSMYSAQISGSHPPVFTLQVLNVKDANNPKILKSYDVPADKVPRWVQPDNDKDKIDDKGRVLPHVVQDWGKSSVEFVPNAGDKIQIRILNSCFEQ